MRIKTLGAASIAVAAFAVPASAHHLYAMFDGQRSIVLEGSVKEFQWTNPHASILLSAGSEQWVIEMGGPMGLARQGWLPQTLTPGMKVTAIVHPLKDGTHGGQFMAVTLPDGKTMGNPNARASANAGAN